MELAVMNTLADGQDSIVWHVGSSSGQVSDQFCEDQIECLVDIEGRDRREQRRQVAAKQRMRSLGC